MSKFQCFLLEDDPESSVVYRWVLNPNSPEFGTKRPYRNPEVAPYRLEAAALWWFPHLPTFWIIRQFPKEHWKSVKKRLGGFAFHPRYVVEARKIAETNMLLVEDRHVVNYFARAEKLPKHYQKFMPFWAWARLNEDRKRGLTLKDLSEKYSLTEGRLGGLFYNVNQPVPSLTNPDMNKGKHFDYVKYYNRMPEPGTSRKTILEFD